MKKQLTLNKFTIAKLNKLEEARIIGGKQSDIGDICDVGVTGKSKNNEGCVTYTLDTGAIC